ncbi:MAG TPA: hypothetical protein VFQ61_35660 [Polyangiaceae bacterium]|nr:hypothetical protein [Polyangiaceae bacterium]
MTKFRNPLSTLAAVNPTAPGMAPTTESSSVLQASVAADKKSHLARAFTVHTRVSPKKVTSFARRMRHK